MIALLLFVLGAPAALAELTLPSVFSDHMVLQRDAAVRVWGKAEPGEQVTVELIPQAEGGKGEPLNVAADPQGNWQVRLKPRPTGQAWRLHITGSQTKKPIVINDVLFGEIWVASGQSNMAWTVADSANATQEIADSANNAIRMWTAQREVKAQPASNVPGVWQVASPQTTGGFSAVAYFFARKLQQDLGVPVGVLHSSWGGTPIEAWTSQDKLESIDWAKPILKRLEDSRGSYDKRMAQYHQDLKRWHDTRNGPENTGFKKGFAKPDFDDSGWPTMALPQTWEKAGINKDGVVWFRKTLTLPDDWAGQTLTLDLGPVDDGDTTYINGEQVGQTHPSAKGAWLQDRRYTVPAKLVKKGELTLAVRVVDLAGGGGIWGKPEQMKLVREDAKGEPISLAGDWHYHLAHELTARNRPTRRPALPFGPEHPHAASGLYNAMIHPIVPYTIRGAIWYQGESNANRAEQYQKLFPAMIQDWRERWGQGDFPFLFVQLANYRQPSDKVEDSDWAHLRDAQLKTLRQVKNTGMAVTIDIGAANDIHPRNKQDVGKRLARWALADTYGKKDVVKSGPIYQPDSLAIANGKATIEFDTFGSKLMSRGVSEPKPHTPFSGFTIAGKDGKFYLAQAQSVTVKGKVIVWSSEVKDPVAVRYAWEDNPDEANLINEEGLPASPFRTDDFKGPTDGRR